ncbi:hypothetical protein Micbo1qcDRAFT_172442 [Microdochium bolleyi]|uniref:Uncharacterized protein n=1 Tax=Microdochium bolleyi TaxID=196109 RepID=A0A136JGA3_9PEZI|nr:hypothetical protein Micbo1qcDRAFT_172442 [Microdochium bolleyi]
MKFTLLTLTTLLASVDAGNLCIAGTYKASKRDVSKLYAFAAGSSCKDGKRMEYKTNTKDICKKLPHGINICGQNGNLVSINYGPKTTFGCRIGLEINGKIYQGKTYDFNPDNANSHKGPCDASCGLKGIDGFLQFVGVPLGSCS